MTDLYSEWRDFYAKRITSWMNLEELRTECGKLATADKTSPELLLIHAMHALEEREQSDKALLRLALTALEGMEKWASSIHDGYPPSTASIAAAPYREAARAAIAALRKRLGEKE